MSSAILQTQAHTLGQPGHHCCLQQQQKVREVEEESQDVLSLGSSDQVTQAGV